MLRPIHDYIAVEPIEREVSSTIIIPETIDVPTMVGRVVSAPETYRDRKGEHPIEVKPGDVVIYSRSGANKVKTQDEEIVLLRQRDIFCRIVPT